MLSSTPPRTLICGKTGIYVHYIGLSMSQFDGPNYKITWTVKRWGPVEIKRNINSSFLRLWRNALISFSTCLSCTLSWRCKTHESGLLKSKFTEVVQQLETRHWTEGRQRGNCSTIPANFLLASECNIFLFHFSEEEIAAFPTNSTRVVQHPTSRFTWTCYCYAPLAISPSPGMLKYL